MANALAAIARQRMTVDQAAQDVFRMQPGMDRLNLLPRHDPKLGWIAPEILYQMARAAVTPGAAARGAEISPQDALNFAGNISLGSYGASRIAPPKGPGKTVGMAASSGKTSPKWLTEIDPNGSLEKNAFGQWQATVHGNRFELGRTKADMDLALSETDLLTKMKAVPINRQLGLPDGALTGQWVVRGETPDGSEFTIDHAKEVAAKIRSRHSSTDYDALLAEGLDKRSARELMQDRSLK